MYLTNSVGSVSVSCYLYDISHTISLRITTETYNSMLKHEWIFFDGKILLKHYLIRKPSLKY